MGAGGGGGGGGRMGVAVAALHEGLRVPMSSQFMRSKYLCCLMENLYTKVHMYICTHVDMHIQRFLFFLNLSVIACMVIPYTLA